MSIPEGAEAHWRSMAADTVNKFWFTNREAGVLFEEIDALRGLLRRYLDNHCANADVEGMSTLCECKLCVETRKSVFGVFPIPLELPSASPGESSPASDTPRKSPAAPHPSDDSSDTKSGS